MKLFDSRKIDIALLFIFLVLSIFPPVPAQAQDEVTIETLQVQIWPEYDQPSLLVIYHIGLSPQTSLPASLNIRMPATAGRPHAVAMQDPAGLYNLDYSMNAAGDWIEISFTTPVPDVRIEFYDPQIDNTQAERSFTYRWPGDHTVENFSLQIQQPPTATNMVFRPGLGSGLRGDDGLTYYNYVVGSVAAGTTFELTVSYTKPDDQLTNVSEYIDVQAQEPITTSTSGRVTPGQVLPWALGVLSLLLIASGGIWLWRTGRAPQPVHSRQRHARKAPNTVENSGGGVFCHQCGKKAGQGDVFCRSCGTRLK